MLEASTGLHLTSRTRQFQSAFCCSRGRCFEMKLQAGPEDRGQRVDVFLAARLEKVTRSHIQAMNKAGAVRINGLQEKAGYRIRGSETIDVDLQKSPVPGLLEPRSMPLEIHYEDEALAVIEKPAGVVVHPGAATGNNTI